MRCSAVARAQGMHGCPFPMGFRHELGSRQLRGALPPAAVLRFTVLAVGTQIHSAFSPGKPAYF